MSMSHVTIVLIELCHTCELERQMSTSHVIHVNERDTCQRVISNISTSHATHVNKSCHTCEIERHMSTSHVKHFNESCHSCVDQVMPYISTSHVTHVNECCPKKRSKTHCNTATHCTCQHCNTLHMSTSHGIHVNQQYHNCVDRVMSYVSTSNTAVCCSALQKTCCNTLQHAATHCTSY